MAQVAECIYKAWYSAPQNKKLATVPFFSLPLVCHSSYYSLLLLRELVK
jgi:hypothetical protein